MYNGNAVPSRMIQFDRAIYLHFKENLCHKSLSFVLFLVFATPTLILSKYGILFCVLQETVSSSYARGTPPGQCGGSSDAGWSAPKLYCFDQS